MSNFLQASDDIVIEYLKGLWNNQKQKSSNGSLIQSLIDNKIIGNPSTINNDLPQDLKNTVVSSFGEVMALAKKMMGYGMKISELLNGLSFSSLKGWFFSAIDDMFKTVKMMSVELMLQVNHMIDSIYLFAYKLIWDFISSLPLIGDAFKALFSPLCIPIPTLR